MHKLTRVAFLCLAAATLTLTGCKTTGHCEDGDACCEEGEAATLSSNENCPISGRPVQAAGQTVSFNGQDVRFCCDGCVGKFEAMSDAERSTALAK